MKTVMPRSFYIIRAVIYAFLLLIAIGVAVQVFGIFIPSIYQGKPLALNYHTEKIDMNISGKAGNDILSLEYFNFDSQARREEGDLTLHSKTGKSYQAYYNSKLEKMRVSIPADFAGSLQIAAWIVYILNPSIIFIVLCIIAMILASLKNGSPFIEKNAKYIRTIAAIIFFDTFIHFILNCMLESYIESELGLVFQLRVDVILTTAILFAMVLALLAYVLKQGMRMKEEQDLTI